MDRRHVTAMTSRTAWPPPLDDVTHAWYDGDDGLVNIILQDSPRTDRMQAWNELLSEQDALDSVVCKKRLCGARALECQEPEHMQCR